MSSRLYLLGSIIDKFLSAFCAFYTHFLQKTYKFKTCALKKREVRQELKCPNELVFWTFYCKFILAFSMMFTLTPAGQILVPPLIGCMYNLTEKKSRVQVDCPNINLCFFKAHCFSMCTFSPYF